MKSVIEAAKELNLSDRRIRVLCTQGRIQGAQKIGRDWLLPDEITITPVQRKRRTKQ